MSNKIKSNQLVDEIMKGLKEYGSVITDDLKNEVKKSARTARKEISQTAPSDSGKYAKSWSAKKVYEDSHSIEMVIHSKTRYRLAHLLENGHAKRGGGRVSAQPHIKAAETKAIEQLENNIVKSLEA